MANFIDVFPARAGMSRLSAMPLIRSVSFPRTRGDEPTRRRAAR